MPVRRSASSRTRASESATPDLSASSTMKSLPRPCILAKLSFMSAVQVQEIVFVDTAVHDHQHARGTGAFCRWLVHHAFLQPQGGEAPRDALIHHFVYIFRRAEHVHQIDAVRHAQEVGIAPFTK